MNGWRDVVAVPEDPLPGLLVTAASTSAGAIETTSCPQKQIASSACLECHAEEGMRPAVQWWHRSSDADRDADRLDDLFPFCENARNQVATPAADEFGCRMNDEISAQ
jgi:hypothetical protein